MVQVSEALLKDLFYIMKQKTVGYELQDLL